MKKKILTTIVLTSCIILLSDCATPLKVANSVPDVAKAIGLASSDINFISYCSFGEAPQSGNHVSAEEGVIAVTGTTLVLTKGDSTHAEVAHRIGFREMRGVDVHHFGLGRQLQIRTNTGIIVIEISKNRALVDPEGTEKVREILRQHRVADWKSDTHYFMTKKIPIIVSIPR